jgi:electron transfer flavoprotein beta subunit
VVVRRQYEDRIHLLRAKMPCLVTALSELNEPRYMTPRGIFEAFRDKTVKILTRADLAIDDGNIGLKGSPTRVMKSFTKAVKGKGTVVELDAGDAAGWITERLQEKFVL